MQTINRNNYEEFFLLYIDGELNAQEQLAVENFVHQNADLGTELEMLMRTKISPETIEFNDKENLLRTEGHNINETNYEEYFLLYIDNELSTAKREEVEMYVLQHPKLQDEFTTLKQTIIAPEAIGYGDKESLYRTEKRRTVYFKPWRFAAAAIIVGVCAVGLWLMQQPGDVKIPVADNNSIQKQPGKNVTAAKPVDTIKQRVKQAPEIAATQRSSQKENTTSGETAVVKKKKENAIISRNEDLNTQQEPVVIQRPVIKQNNIAAQQKEPPAVINDVTIASEDFDQKQNDIAALQTLVSDDENPSDFKIYPVAYKEINTNDNDRSLHVGMLDLNKDKVKTLFKKAGRMFGSKSNDLANEDGKLQVANFEIETKKQ